MVGLEMEAKELNIYPYVRKSHENAEQDSAVSEDMTLHPEDDQRELKSAASSVTPEDFLPQTKVSTSCHVYRPKDISTPEDILPKAEIFAQEEVSLSHEGHFCSEDCFPQTGDSVLDVPLSEAQVSTTEDVCKEKDTSKLEQMWAQLKIIAWDEISTSSEESICSKDCFAQGDGSRRQYIYAPQNIWAHEKIFARDETSSLDEESICSGCLLEPEHIGSLESTVSSKSEHFADLEVISIPEYVWERSKDPGPEDKPTLWRRLKKILTPVHRRQYKSQKQTKRRACIQKPDETCLLEDFQKPKTPSLWRCLKKSATFSFLGQQKNSQKKKVPTVKTHTHKTH